MARKHPCYTPEFRLLIELVRAGRTPEELAKEFEPSHVRSRRPNHERLAEKPVASAAQHR